MSDDATPAELNSLPTPKLRTLAEDAFVQGNLRKATVLSNELGLRSDLGPWEKNLLGRIALAEGRAGDALDWLQKASADLPGEGAIQVEMARALAANKKWNDAATTLAQAIEQRPQLPDLHERHGTYLANAGCQAEAEESFLRALALDPDHAGVLAIMGERFLSRGDITQAKQALEKSLERDPTNVSAASNLALAHENQGDLKNALDVLMRYGDAANPTLRHRRGQLLLSLGKLSDGWSDYAQRLKSKTYKSWQYALRIPYWAGEDLSGGSLLVWTDQGLGEQVLTVSMVNQVMLMAGAVTLACDPRLIPLFQRSFPAVRVVSLEAMRDGGKDLGKVDWQASISELGAALRPGLTRFPAAAPFLKACDDRVKHMRSVLGGNGDRPLVGISWRSVNPLAGAAKSTELARDWQSVLLTPDMKFVCLQYGDVARDLAAVKTNLGVDIVMVPDLDFERDIDGFAAAVAAVDMVVSTSNTAVHVAGGVGRPVKAIIPSGYGRPWYWFDEGDVSPWYNDVTLYRSQGNWRAALDRAAADLAQWPAS